MLLPGCEWDLIERYEKLCGVVLQKEKSTARSLRQITRGRQPLHCLLCIAVHAALHIWPQLTKDIVQRSYLNFKEDE